MANIEHRTPNAMNILLSSAGRRVALTESFRQALKGRGRVLATDADPTAPALYAADKGILVPRADDVGYVPALLDICRTEGVGAVIPLIDTELPGLARAHDEFRRVGTQVLLAGPDSVETCFDKLQTASLFERLEIPAPGTVAGGRWSVAGGRWPVVVKPRRGSAGKGVNIARTAAEVDYWLAATPDALIQELLVGPEVTTDVLCDLEGRPLLAVQRERLKTRGGEVERGVTVCHPKITEYALRAAEALRPAGAINIQCFLTKRGPLFTEINPRFGGGYPLAHAAGAAFPERIVAMLVQGPQPSLPALRVGVVMMRFDQAVFRTREELLT